VVMWCSGVV